jgi:hypothetical protein
MAFSTRTDMVPAVEVTNTKEMTLKILQARKQECKSRIVRAKQEIEDLRIAKFAELEYQILHAEAELKKLEAHEAMVIESKDVQQSS